MPSAWQPRVESAVRHERRGLILGIGGNLVGAVSGIGMYVHSRSDALLLDGLYTAVLAVSGLVALKVSQSAMAPRNRAYPFGASGQEPLYMLFQSLVMIGMVTFAGISAAGKMLAVAAGGATADVQLSGLSLYFSAMVGLNLALWWLVRRHWQLSGGSSDLLLSNSNTSLFDAAISGATGVALVSSPQLLNTPLAPLAPMVDSLIVLVLSALFLPAPLRELLRAIAESAGVSVDRTVQQRCHNAVAAALEQGGCALVELAMIKLGRTFTVVAYIDPALPLRSRDVDQLRQQLNRLMQLHLQAPVLCEVILTGEHPYGNDLPNDNNLPNGNHGRLS
ncbi:MAG: cation transporter [Cyanobacteriota bacterium]|nr:cation transporter [Cyanobacteriota bacterium]